MVRPVILPVTIFLMEMSQYTLEFVPLCMSKKLRDKFIPQTRNERKFKIKKKKSLKKAIDVKHVIPPFIMGYLLRHSKDLNLKFLFIKYLSCYFVRSQSIRSAFNITFRDIINSA